MSKINSYFNYLIVILLGISIRFFLSFTSYQKIISERVEISTPITSWKRVVEAIFLLDSGISPYNGEIFHETPIFLYFYKFLNNIFSNYIPIFFILIDLTTSLFLCLTSNLQLRHLYELEEDLIEKFKDEENKKQIEISKKKINDICFKIFAIYMLNPYSILSCIGQSTGVINNFFIVLSLYFATKNFKFLSTLFISLLTMNTIYYSILILPIALIIEFKKNNSSNELKKKTSEEEKPIEKDDTKLIDSDEEEFIEFESKIVYFNVYSTIFTFILCFINILILSYISLYLMNFNYDYINSTYLFRLSVLELTPNIGIYWYFFTEMFDHFREFFLWVIQINAFIFIIPLSITLKKNPYFYFYVFLIFISTFRPYPSITDLSIYVALLPQWTHILNLLKHGFVIATTYLVCSILAPIMWHLWIVIGTANANFYFGITLAYNTAQIFFFTNLLFAFTKRQFFLEKRSMKDETNKPYKLKLAYN